MSETKIQENKQKIDIIEEKTIINPNLKFFSRFASSFKILFIRKSRIKHFDKQYQNKKKRLLNGWLKSTFTVFGIILIMVITTIALFSHWLAPYSYEEASSFYLYAWKPPSPLHPLGTAYAGRDVLSRIIYGTSTYLSIAVLSVSLSVIIGTILGMLAGYYGKWVDSIIMRTMDVILAFPGLIFALAFLAIFGPKYEYIVIVLGIIGIPYYSRLVRSSVIKEKELDYVAAAKVVGATKRRIMFRHILPNSIQPVIITLSYDIGRVLINLTILGFLGFSDPRFIDWGGDIFSGRTHLWEAPWGAFWPCVMILVSVIGFMIVGDGLRDALDPKYQY